MSENNQKNIKTNFDSYFEESKNFSEEDIKIVLTLLDNTIFLDYKC